MIALFEIVEALAVGAEVAADSGCRDEQRVIESVLKRIREGESLEPNPPATERQEGGDHAQ